MSEDELIQDLLNDDDDDDGDEEERHEYDDGWMTFFCACALCRSSSRDSLTPM